MGRGCVEGPGTRNGNVECLVGMGRCGPPILLMYLTGSGRTLRYALRLLADNLGLLQTQTVWRDGGTRLANRVS